MIPSPTEQAWNRFMDRLKEIRKAQIDLAEKEIELYEDYLKNYRGVQKTKRLIDRILRRK